MYETILLPTDGSQNAQIATERAVNVADQYDAELHALYVREKTSDDPEVKGLDEKLTEELHQGRQILEDVEKQARKKDIVIETVLETGVPRTVIEEYAADQDIGLIIMGSTGADSVPEKVLGTVSKYIVNEAPADVFLIRPDSQLM